MNWNKPMRTNSLPLGDPAVHFWLTRSAARAMGINLSEAIAAGRLSAQAYAQMVTACRRCPHVESCRNWLASEAMAQYSAFTDCPNRQDLEQLQ